MCVLTSGVLCVQWGCSEWDATYTELPNRALKVKVTGIVCYVTSIHVHTLIAHTICDKGRD